MRTTLVVTGVPGVGASRVCQEARRELGDEHTLFNFGDVMLEEALELGLADSRDALTRLPIRDQRLLQRRAAELIARSPGDGPLIVNTHLVVHTAHGFIPGLPGGVRSEISPTALVVIDAPAETIQQRRAESERNYPSETGATVAFHRQLQTAATLTHATGADIPIRYVSNHDDIETAAERLVTLVRAAES